MKQLDWKKISLLAVTILSSVILSAIFALIKPPLCARRSCVAQANNLRTFINRKISPCEDFELLTCGRPKNDSKDVTTDRSIFDHFEEELDEFYWDMLNSTANFPITDNFLKSAMKDLFVDCHNAVRDRENSPTFVENGYLMLKFIEMNFPYHLKSLNKSQESLFLLNFTIEKYEVESRACGFNGQSLFAYQVSRCPDSNGEVCILLEPPTFRTITTDDLLKIYKSDSNDKIDLYKHVLHGLCSEYYQMPGFICPHDMIDDVYELEKNITKLVTNTTDWSKTFKTDITYLNNNFKFLDWNLFFQLLFRTEGDISMSVVMFDKSYFDSLAGFINDLNSASKQEVVGVYMVLKNLMEFSFLLPNKHTDFTVALKTVIESLQYPTTFCYKMIDQQFGNAITHFIIDKFRIKEGGNKVLTKITDSIVDFMHRSIKQSSWMDSQTQKNALTKLKNLKYSLSVAEEDFDSMSNRKSCEEYYLDFSPHGDLPTLMRNSNLLQLMKNIDAYHTKNISAFHIKYLAHKPRMYYDQYRNELVVPIGILRFPGFYQHYPLNINYAMIGTEIASTLMYGFELEGADFDTYGRNISWWSEETNNTYQQRMETCENSLLGRDMFREPCNLNVTSDDFCGKKNYNFFHAKGLDSVDIAFKAYTKEKQKRIIKEYELYGLSEHYDYDQLFFLSFANMYCVKNHTQSGVGEIKHKDNSKTLIKLLTFSDNLRKSFNCEKAENNVRNSLNLCKFW